MHTVRFKYCTPPKGIYTTIRIGNKWANRVVPGEEVEVYDQRTNLSTAGYIRSIKVSELRYLSGSDLAREHDPGLRTPGGVSGSMARVYPHHFDALTKEQAMSQTVTVLEILQPKEL